MSAKSVILILISCHIFCGFVVQGKSIYGVGQRILGDELLLKDVQSSRPAGVSEPPRVVFNYVISEPITYIEIISEENILAEVKFSYMDKLVVGMVTVFPGNYSENKEQSEWEDNSTASLAFDVLITIYGFNETMLNVNPALLLNRDQHFEGVMEPWHNDVDAFATELDEEESNDNYANVERNVLQVDLEDPEEVLEQDDDDEQAVPTAAGEEFEPNDKIIEVGERQTGDYLIYQTYQTSPDADGKADQLGNHTTTFYYIDSDFITHIKFVLFDHYAENQQMSAVYQPPVAEYTHYSPNTFKAVITDFNTSSLFVQMFVYGYRPADKPEGYVSFLPQTLWQRTLAHIETPPLTPMQRVQLLLLTGKLTTAAPHSGESGDPDEETPASIRAEDMRGEHIHLDNGPHAEPGLTNAVSEQSDRYFWAVLVGMGLLLLHN